MAQVTRRQQRKREYYCCTVVSNIRLTRKCSFSSSYFFFFFQSFDYIIHTSALQVEPLEKAPVVLKNHLQPIFASRFFCFLFTTPGRGLTPTVFGTPCRKFGGLCRVALNTPLYLRPLGVSYVDVTCCLFSSSLLNAPKRAKQGKQISKHFVIHTTVCRKSIRTTESYEYYTVCVLSAPQQTLHPIVVYLGCRRFL